MSQQTYVEELLIAVEYGVKWDQNVPHPVAETYRIR